MGHWANYTGSLDMPVIEYQEEEFIYNVRNGKRYPVSNMDIAQANVKYWKSQGVECSIETEIKTVGYEKVYHGPSGAEYNA